jgi:hypothetical protein
VHKFFSPLAFLGIQRPRLLRLGCEQEEISSATALLCRRISAAHGAATQCAKQPPTLRRPACGVISLWRSRRSGLRSEFVCPPVCTAVRDLNTASGRKPSPVNYIAKIGHAPLGTANAWTRIGTAHSHSDAVPDNVLVELSISSRYETAGPFTRRRAGPSPQLAGCPKPSSHQCLMIPAARGRQFSQRAFIIRSALVSSSRAFVHCPFAAFLEFLN